ncbi:rhodanese-like domain-containing protein [Capnocytophaga sp. HP1101]
MSILVLCTVTAQAQSLAERLNAGNVTLIDVRTPQEYTAGTAEGAVNIPLEEMGTRWQELKGKENIVLFCRRGIRAGKAQDILKAHNITAVNGKTVEHVKSLQKVNLLNKLTFKTDKPTTYFVKDGKNVRQIAIALGKGAVLKKHTTDVSATLIMIKGEVRFLINDEEIVLKDLDTYQIPVDIPHEVIGVGEENVFIVTKGN